VGKLSELRLETKLTWASARIPHGWAGGGMGVCVQVTEPLRSYCHSPGRRYLDLEEGRHGQMLFNIT
jgi:hypothetical protein